MNNDTLQKLKIERDNYAKKGEYLKADKINEQIKFIKEKIKLLPKFYKIDDKELNNDLETEYKEIENYFKYKISVFNKDA